NTTIARTTISNNIAGESGAGVWHHTGALTLTDCIITGNQTRATTTMTSEGGGVWSGTRLTMTRCTVTDNKAGYYQDLNANGGGFGGGVFSVGALDIVESSITGNSALQGLRYVTSPYGYAGVGGGVYHTGDEANIVRSTVANNYAGYLGGGIVHYVGS